MLFRGDAPCRAAASKSEREAVALHYAVPANSNVAFTFSFCQETFFDEFRPPLKEFRPIVS